MCIYIYIERERHMFIHIDIYIYIYISNAHEVARSGPSPRSGPDAPGSAGGGPPPACRGFLLCYSIIEYSMLYFVYIIV